jgi:spore germination protein GerM
MNRFTAILAVALLVGACGGATGDLGSVATPPPTEQPSLEAPSGEPTPGTTEAPGESPGATPSPTQSGTTTVRAYFVLGSFQDNAGLVPVLRDVPKTKAVGGAAIDELIKGPNDAELGARPAMYTNIPDGTTLLGLTIKDGIATVNLSKEFDGGGGSATMLGRLAQVVYTLTQFPTVTGVQFQVDGRPMTVFNENGNVVAGPFGRDDYAAQLPAIFVDRPAWGGVLGSPARLVGVANVFEATFRVEILDGQGRSLAATPVTATCGSGCWGTFDVTVRYTVSRAGWGTLRVWEPSAKDGSVTNLTEYPVWLTP